MEDIILVGYGGHAKSVADCIERSGKFHIVGYTERNCHDAPYPYLGTDDVLNDWFQKGMHNAVVCVGFMGTGTVREKLYRQLKEIGFTLPVIADPSSIISSSAVVAEGAFIGKLAVVNADAVVGRMAIINSKALVEHECRVGEFTHVAVGAVLCGQVTVGKASLVGANATVLQCIDIPDCCVIPAGEIIRRNYKVIEKHDMKILVGGVQG